ncbi:YbjQ family protein [Rhodanobacter sp. L36]|uniref:YbjQ family protein n=1 Tax=Rhodanobacter sp. L36 TaxID=1747221 RepID=UPI00131D38DA|nr:YbjQ family protein [Rhodanobacter sp. L36]
MANNIPHSQVSTGNELVGYRITRSLGVVRGITVRSRSVIGNIGAALQTLVGGNISIYAELCEKSREDAFDLMLQHAAALGANAVVAMRYDANEIAEGVTEVLAYGTAVQVEPAA